MSAHYPLEFLLKDIDIVQVVSNAGTKLTQVILKSENREETSRQIKENLVSHKIVYDEARRSGSSFPSIEIRHDNRLYRIIFKPVKTPTADTSLTEGAQCVYLAAAQFAKQDVDDNYVQFNLDKFRSYFDVDCKVEQIFELSATWKKSSVLIANHLRLKLRKSNYVFHRNSSFTKQIYAVYAKLNAQEGKVFSAPDKWNPADIWAVERGKTFSFADIDSIFELNVFLRTHIDNGTIVPISLKQTNRRPQIETVNTNESRLKQTTTVAYQPKNIAATNNTGRGDWTSSKSNKISFDIGVKSAYFEIRQSKPGAKINSEMKVKQTTARHGKVNIEDIQKMFKQVGQTFDIIPNQQLNKLSYARDQGLIDKVWVLGNKLDPRSNVPKMQFVNFIRSTNDIDWLAAKYQGMLIIEAFARLTKPAQTKLIELWYSKSAASAELGGPFLKVS